MAYSFEQAYFIAKSYYNIENEINGLIEYLIFEPNVTGHISMTSEVHEQFPNCKDLIECLVIMFGDYGVSPTYGWIEKPEEAITWLNSMKEYWSDGYVDWSTYKE